MTDIEKRLYEENKALRSLALKQELYIKFLSKRMSAYFSNAYAHGLREDVKHIERGKRFRQKIKQLKSQAGLDDTST